ncbi:MAG: hypothetical protein M1838_002975 [Thelocarpon superellum]|nr:MAG: hypothetical protein M1838_002975 [Thelocarpon superellum]
MSGTSSTLPPRLSEYSTTPGSFPGALGLDHPATASSQRSLAQAVKARRADYIRPQQLRVKIGSWNVAAKAGVENDIGAWFIEGKAMSESLTGLEDATATVPAAETVERESVEHQEERADPSTSTVPRHDRGTLAGGSAIDLYVVGLQEVVDVASPAETLRPFTDPTTAERWKRALSDALSPGYQLVAEQQLVGLLLLIYASPNIAPSISSVSTVNVGTGLMGYMGNKGGVAARLVLAETTSLVFVNCHLAAGAEKTSLERRNWDAAQIVNRTRFDPIRDEVDSEGSGGETIGDEDVAWWFGDLNYRLDGLPGDDVRRLLMLHTRNEYDIGSREEEEIEEKVSVNGDAVDVSDLHPTATAVDPMSAPGRDRSTSTSAATSREETSPDPASLQTTLASLLPHDQLRQQQAAGHVLHDGWREGPITFLPTYKYDVGSVGVFDSGEKRRGPSWCDRILFRTRRDRQAYDARVKEAEEARKRDQEMHARGVDQAAAEDEDVLFDYDPDTDGADEEPGAAEDLHADLDRVHLSPMKDASQDRVRVEVYTSHQRVLSSDHKPITAIFNLCYDGVVPELKAKVHQEVARDLDRAENESRPGVTLVVDRSHEDPPRSPGVSTAHGGPTTDNDVVDFGHVCYLQQKVRTVTVANTSRVPSRVNFMPRPMSTEALGDSSTWLDIRFDGSTARDANHEICIQPGDAINVHLVLCVEEMQLVRALNGEHAKLDAVLVLSVAGGRDHFISVRASWLQSCFGRSIDELICVPEGGVRVLAPGKASSLNVEHDKKWSAPKELFRLTAAVEELVERVVAERKMTETAKENRAPWENYVGWPFKSKSWTYKDTGSRATHRPYVHEALDTDQEPRALFPPEVPALERLELISEVLVSFLESLQDGVITESLWRELEQGLIAREKSKEQISVEEERSWILDVLSRAPNHNISFVFLTSMLARVAAEVAPLRPGTDTAPPSSSSSSIMPSSCAASTSTTSHSTVNASTLSSTILSSPLQIQVPRLQHQRRCFLVADSILTQTYEQKQTSTDTEP